MKKFGMLWFGILMLIWPVLSRSASQAETLHIATYHWPPYQTYQNKKLDGISVKVVKCVLEKMNQPYKISVLPSKRAKALVKEGQYDAYFSASIDETYEDFAVRSKAIAEQRWNWYTLKETLVDPTYFFFKENAYVSALSGSDMRKWLENNGYRLKTDPSQPESLFKLLEILRIDAALSSEEVAEPIIKNMDLSDRINVTLVRNKPLGVYFSIKFISKHPDFLNKFNQLIKSCR